jgi:hypothetical protein
MRPILALLLALLALDASADLQAGIEALKRNDYATAYKEWLPLAEQGDRSAQFGLARLYTRGDGVEKSYEEAAKWARRSAEQDHDKAQELLGTFYANGLGVPKDHLEAGKWFVRAAENGNGIAAYNLGVLYANGQGVEKEPVKAYMWFHIAVFQGYQEAADAVKKLSELMVPQQIVQAEQMADEWLRHMQMLPPSDDTPAEPALKAQ